jgi:UDP-glucose:glycoprotein glucosyltransferase
LEYLEEHAKRAPGFSFVVRYKPDNAREGDGERRRSSLGGYGVEMVLKRTDYLAVDDRVTGEHGLVVCGRDEVAHMVVRKAGDLRDSPSNETVNQHKPSSQDDELMSVFGQDPWSELTRPLRPSEIAGE